MNGYGTQLTSLSDLLETPSLDAANFKEAQNKVSDYEVDERGALYWVKDSHY